MIKTINIETASPQWLRQEIYKLIGLNTEVLNILKVTRDMLMTTSYRDSVQCLKIEKIINKLEGNK